MLFSANPLQNSFSKLNYWGGHFVGDLSPTMAFWTDNMSNISDEELFKDDLRLDSILAKEVTVSEDLFDRGSVTSEDVSEVPVLKIRYHGYHGRGTKEIWGDQRDVYCFFC